MRQSIFSFLALILLFTACSDSTELPIVEEPKDTDPMSENSQPIDVFSRLYIQQNLDGANSFELVIENTEAIECLEDIRADWKDGADGLELIVDYVNDPGCTQGEELGSLAISLAIIESEIEVDLTIEDQTNTLKVNKTEEAIEFKFRTMDKISMAQTKMNRIPEELAWGYANLTNTECRDIQASYNQLMGIPADQITEHSFEEGEYGYFTIGDLNVVIGMENQTDDYGQSMLLDLSRDGSWRMLEELLSGMVTGCPDLKYFFQNAEGEILAN